MTLVELAASQELACIAKIKLELIVRSFWNGQSGIAIISELTPALFRTYTVHNIIQLLITVL